MVASIFAKQGLFILEPSDDLNCFKGVKDSYWLIWLIPRGGTAYPNYERLQYFV